MGLLWVPSLGKDICRAILRHVTSQPIQLNLVVRCFLVLVSRTPGFTFSPHSGTTVSSVLAHLHVVARGLLGLSWVERALSPHPVGYPVSEGVQSSECSTAFLPREERG